MERQITDAAMGQLTWINDTYTLYEDIDKWCKSIVASAKNPIISNTEVTLEDVLNEMETIAETPELDFCPFCSPE